MANMEGPKASSGIQRRGVLKSMAGVVATCVLPPALMGLETAVPAAASINPKWYGFNLMEYFSTDKDWMNHFPYKNDGIFLEDDFKWISDWGFNWVRLPMDYRFWTDANDPMKIDEKMVERIDRTIRLGEKYSVHVNICLHRAPGFSVLDGGDHEQWGIHITNEKTNLFRDQSAQDAFVHQWDFFAGRYKGISSKKVSFNLVNEPMDISGKEPEAAAKMAYLRVARAAVAAI